MKKETIDIDFSATFKALKRFIDRHNDLCERRTDRITASMRSLAEHMLRMYLGQINGKLIDPTLNFFPGFHTFNDSLAKERGCTSRTIINLRQRLVKSGVIIKEERNGFEGLTIWFSDSFFSHNKLYTSMNLEVKNFQVISSSMKSNMKNIHPLVIYHELINNNSNVDKWKSIETLAGEKEKIMNTGKMGLGVEDELIEASPPSHSLLPLVENFWLRARIKLYPYERFDQERTRRVLNFIWESVYGKFQYSGSEKEWQEYHKIALRRIDMVHRWLHRKPHHWIPIPEIYFDPLNKKNGFKRTWDWYLKGLSKEDGN
jgi:hypothetical protein